MALNNLKKKKGSTIKNYRKGRGVGSGNGKTAGKGHKGQRSRSGHMKVGFEGGQNPLYRRLPKFGFNHYGKKEYAIVNLSQLNKYKDGTTINADLLLKDRVIRSKKDGLKILSNGDIKVKLNVEANKISKSAQEKITKAGGTIKLIK